MKSPFSQKFSNAKFSWYMVPMFMYLASCSSKTFHPYEPLDILEYLTQWSTSIRRKVKPTSKNRVIETKIITNMNMYSYMYINFLYVHACKQTKKSISYYLIPVVQVYRVCVMLVGTLWTDWHDPVPSLIVLMEQTHCLLLLADPYISVRREKRKERERDRMSKLL